MAGTKTGHACFPIKVFGRNNHMEISVLFVYLQVINGTKTGQRMKLIELNIEKIVELCKRFHVRKLWVFGSILTNRFNDKSDVDLCVDFEWENIPLMEAADNFFDFQNALENVFGRKVDITDDSAVRNPYFREELNEKRLLIYG